jgi:uncharacterized spore protein YtfJ
MGRPKVFQIRTVRGDPYQVGGRTLVPVARIVSFGKARATVGANRIGGWGGGFAWVRPLALLEQIPEGERRVPIRDSAAPALRVMFGAAVAATLFFALLRWLVRRA